MRLRKIDFFLNELMKQTFCLLGLLNSRQSKTNFVSGYVLLNCRLRPLSILSESDFLAKKRLFLSFSCFLYLFNASIRPFCTLSLPNRVKYYLDSQTFRHFKT